MIRRIVSGGQTGVDRAALECARALGFPVGGYCPAGYRAEDGVVPEALRAVLTCTGGRDYQERTRLNVATSDATLILARGELTGGTALTAEICRELGKPYLCVDTRDATAASAASAWLALVRPGVLNVAGPREGTHPGIYDEAYPIVSELLESLRR